MKYHLSVCLVIAALTSCEGPPEPIISAVDEASCVDPAARNQVEGPFANPIDLVVSAACQPGALAEFDPSGSWFFEQDNLGIFSGSGPVHFDLACETGLSVELATNTSTFDVEDNSLSEDYLFWRRVRTFEDFDLSIVDAYLICGVTALGTHIGLAVRCFVSDEGDDCQTTGLSMRPFERLEGEGEADGLELVSEYAGQAWSWRGDFVANVRVHEGLAYVVLQGGGLRIVDVSDPAKPTEIGALAAQGEEGFNDVKIVTDEEGGPFALLASDARGLVVVDVGDPKQPRDILSLTPSGEVGAGIHTIFIERVEGKNMAYLADGVSNVVTIWDVTEPRVPLKVGTYTSEDEDWAVHDLFADQGRLYLNATVGGMIVVDTQPSPATPVERGQYTPQNIHYSHSNWVTTVNDRKISVHGDEGYDAHFKVIDADEESETFMQEIGRYQTRAQVSAHNVMAFGDKAYVAYYQDGVRILDLSDPTEPTLAAYFNTWNPRRALGARFEGAVGIDVDLDKGLIYVADQPRGLLILREK